MSKFLSYEDRMIIAQRLQENASFGAIGKELGKDRTTIAKEIKKYSYDKKSGRPGYPYNPCKFRATCKAKRICGTSCTHQSAYKCSLCSECTLHCSDFVEDVCSVKNKPPYVCNGCSQLPKCTLLKRIYDPADAHERAHHAVSEARTGIMSNEDDIARINGIISPLVKNGQSLHQIYLAHVDELMCSEKTLYNYVDAQLFDIGTLAQGKRTTVSHKVKKEIAVPECDWVVVENAHEAIISRMDFDAVQILMTRDFSAFHPNGCCCREYINYICSNYNRNGKDACSRHCIREEDLNQIVLGELQGYINSMCDCEKVLAHLDELNVNYDEAVAHDKEIVARKQELTKCSAFKASLYQDLRDEIISKEQFTRYREEFSAKERELEQAIREQETIIRDIYENGIAVAKDLEQFREGLVIGNLDRVALVSFIDRILIYDDFRVEIVFKYRQEMEKVTGLFDVANEKNAEPVYTMVDGLPVLELKEAV